MKAIPAVFGVLVLSALAVAPRAEELFVPSPASPEVESLVVESLVVNGGFERRATGDPPNYIQPLAPSDKDLTGWEVVEGSVDWIGPTRWRAAEGASCLDLDAPGAIRQTLATLPGEVYVLSFDLAGNVETPPSEKELLVDLGGHRQVFRFNATGRTPDSMGWTRQQIVFKAVGEQTTLTFANASPQPTASGVALDNVSVRAAGDLPTAPAAAGRFSLATAGERVVLLDSTTGQTWLLVGSDQGPYWKPLPPADNGEPRE